MRAKRMWSWVSAVCAMGLWMSGAVWAGWSMPKINMSPCLKGETVAFSCHLNLTERVSLCIVQPPAKKGSTAPKERRVLIFRAGSAQKFGYDLVIPSHKTPMTYQHETYSGGFRSALTFSHKGNTYTVFEQLLKVDIAKQAHSAGIEMQSPKQKQRVYKCLPLSIKGKVDGLGWVSASKPKP